MQLKGANLEEVEVNYGSLSSHDLVDSKYIQYLENLYYELSKESQTIEVHDFPCEDGKACVKPFMLNHRCSSDLDTLKNISEYGVLASEWFGILESEKEGRFCAFVDRIKPLDFRDKWANTRRLNAGSDNVLLFFDEDNPIMQKLLHLDYFEYERIKKEEPDKIPLFYSEEEIGLLNDLIEPLSPAGKNFHDTGKSNTQYYYWSAIPGGIPSSLVNGICLKNNVYTEEYLNKLIELFPNATIFNGTLDIIYRPERIQNKA